MTILGKNTQIDSAKGFVFKKGNHIETFKTYEEASKALRSQGGIVIYHIKK